MLDKRIINFLYNYSINLYLKSNTYKKNKNYLKINISLKCISKMAIFPLTQRLNIIMALKIVFFFLLLLFLFAKKEMNNNQNNQVYEMENVKNSEDF